MASVSAAVEEKVGSTRHNFIFALLRHTAVIEVIPVVGQVVKACGSVVTSSQASIVVGYSIKVVMDWVSFIL